MHHVDIPLDDLQPMRTGRASWSGWWRTLPAAARAPRWPAALGGLVSLALLIGFHQVVHDAVKQGELLRLSAANRAEALWRCNSLTRAAVRSSCLAQIDMPRPVRADVAPPPNTAALSLARAGS